MAIPEPEFKIDVYQQIEILVELGYIKKSETAEQHIELIHKIRNKLIENLDTV